MSNKFGLVKTPTPRGIQSVEVGGQLLRALAAAGRAMALKDLAAAADMTPAKAHPYLVSFSKLGLIEQDPETGRYGLGAFGVQLGLIGLQQIDAVRLASAALPDLAVRVGHTVAIAVWGTQGPTIIRTEAGPAAVYVNMRLGTTMSVEGTASGRLFAAYMPDHEQVQQALYREAAQGIASTVWDDDHFQDALKSIRKKQVSVVKDSLVNGVSAIAVPVFDAFSHIVLALVTIGPSATLDLRPHSVPITALKASAHTLSTRLGANWL